PQGDSLDLRFEIPERVDDRSNRHMGDALFGTEPAPLRIIRQLARIGTHAAEDRIDARADEAPAEGSNGGNLHVVAPSDSEYVPVPLFAVTRANDDIGRGVVGVRVHRI